MVTYGNSLYVGGDIYQAGNQTVSGLAVYNFTTSTWSNLGVVCGGGVTSMAILNDFLYIAGSFTSYDNSTCPGVPGLNLAEYSLVNSAFTNSIQLSNSSLTGSVSLLTIYDGYLSVGGNFSKIGQSKIDRLALYNTTTGLFYPVVNSGFPFTGSIYVSVGTNSTLYLGGKFTSSYWGVIELNLGIWASMNAGVACTICPALSDGTDETRRVPWVYTLAILPPGLAPVITPTITVPQAQLMSGNWQEYVSPFPGLSALFLNGTQYTLSTLNSALPQQFYWQTWSVIGSGIFIGSLLLAVLLNMCVKSVSSI